ncbi:hypothetical protein FA95DRAFT_696116 [Auriscalpium vulgare]|uniref:Uncharacterized protein n=1 Tax=Auriscalpium vulgare TaxID=40419 RepID=A0ACB8RCM6_9AGAM|nr:hypothetical protein FA95DRAFT_696116 [Auriscalpium vulgare]
MNRPGMTRSTTHVSACWKLVYLGLYICFRIHRVCRLARSTGLFTWCNQRPECVAFFHAFSAAATSISLVLLDSATYIRVSLPNGRITLITSPNCECAISHAMLASSRAAVKSWSTVQRHCPPHLAHVSRHDPQTSAGLRKKQRL